MVTNYISASRIMKKGCGDCWRRSVFVAISFIRIHTHKNDKPMSNTATNQTNTKASLRGRRPLMRRRGNLCCFKAIAKEPCAVCVLSKNKLGFEPRYLLSEQMDGAI